MVAMPFRDLFHVGVDVLGADDEAVGRGVDILIVADRDAHRTDAIRVPALAHERHNLFLDPSLRFAGAVLKANPPIVVVAKRQLVLHESIAANIVPPALSQLDSIPRGAPALGQGTRSALIRKVSACTVKGLVSASEGHAASVAESLMARRG